MSFSDKEKEILARPEFREGIEKLNSLLQQNKRLFLIGAGCSKCAELPLMSELTAEVFRDFAGTSTGSILDHIKQSSNNRGTIEDYLSELIDHLAIAERRQGFCDESTFIKIKIGEAEFDCSTMRESVEEIKVKIKDRLNKEIAIDIHSKFVSHIHKTLRPGKPSERENVDYLILNYDTLFEDALAFSKIDFVDGFKGGASAFWDSDLFFNGNTKAKVIKLHGSIDWLLFNNEIFPRRINSKVKLSSLEPHSILIYPATTKYMETSVDPFAKLFEIARSSLRTDKDQQKVLIIAGYSFGDRHINLEIENALKQSEGHLTIIAFVKDKDNKVLSGWLCDTMYKSNVLVYSEKGIVHGDQTLAQVLEGEEIEWWKFEKLTKLLIGEL